MAKLWVLEETSGHVRRMSERTESPDSSAPISIRLYGVSDTACELVDEVSYAAGSLQQEGSEQSRAQLATELLKRIGATSGIVVATHRLGGAAALTTELQDLELDFVVEVPPHIQLNFQSASPFATKCTPNMRLRGVKWQQVDLKASHTRAEYRATHVGPVSFGTLDRLNCFAVGTGGVGYQRGLLVGLTSLRQDTPVEELARLLLWTRWVRLFARRAMREGSVRAPIPQAKARGEGADQLTIDLPVRANQQIARKLDERHAANWSADLLRPDDLRGALTQNREVLNVVELFAGAGGMGLGFLLAKTEVPRFRIVHSAEVHPIYVQTLRHNHQRARTAGICVGDAVPSDLPVPQDLRCSYVADEIADRIAQIGDTDVLIGGPPCQGFSSANRNSWSSANPNNRLVDTFLDYVKRLRPKVLLMENVQGILWTPKHQDVAEELSVATHVAGRLSALGYRIYPKLVDAAWYGVPQHRNRFFLLGIHSDLGYRQDDFGFWGPFPVPMFGPGTSQQYVTVRQAISDLPPIANGAASAELPYSLRITPENWFLAQMRRAAPEGVVWDHVASKHANYVIERYRNIRPGGNWEDVAEMMTNYADVQRTHSNIYRRLKWDEPAITIGHYRKSMIVHPEQHRGLSLREAGRLQSFPDWFRFAGAENGLGGGLTHKQQQLANAVCPLVTKAVAEYLLRL